VVENINTYQLDDAIATSSIIDQNIMLMATQFLYLANLYAKIPKKDQNYVSTKQKHWGINKET